MCLLSDARHGLTQTLTDIHWQTVIQTQWQTDRQTDRERQRTSCIQVWLRRQLSNTTWSSMSAERDFSSSTCTQLAPTSSSAAELERVVHYTLVIHVVGCSSG